MSRPLTWMSKALSKVTCSNTLMVRYGQCIVVIPWSNHPPAIPRAMTSIDTPRRLTFWPHLSATMPWKPAGFANLSTWYHLMLGWDRDLLGRDDFACAYHAMGSWPLGRTTHGSWEATPLAASSFQDFRYLETSILTTVHSWSGRYKEMISATLLGHHLVVMVPSCAASGWLVSETWKNVPFHPRSSSKDVPIMF